MCIEVKPKPKIVKEKPAEPPFPFVGIVVILIITALKFTDVVEFIDGIWQVKAKRVAQIDKKIEEIDDAEQYILMARVDGWYPCYTCLESKTIYLFKNEIVKVGVSQKKQNRYLKDWYQLIKVSYQPEYIGAYNECLKREMIRLRDYPLLPEVLKREPKYRTALPPMNKITK